MYDMFSTGTGCVKVQSLDCLLKTALKITLLGIFCELEVYLSRERTDSFVPEVCLTPGE